MRILIFVVTYNAEKLITETLDRIPRSWLASNDYEIFIVDDASTDQTKRVIDDYVLKHNDLNIIASSNDQNLGYGGNQKHGYAYAIKEGFDLVVLLHGDGQYAPEFLPQMAAPIQKGQADVVLGSRMMEKMNALKGKMPLYKWLGNQVLTTFQNLFLGTGLSEFHTGYRSYRVGLLREIPIEKNSDYFDFDTEIIIQTIHKGARIKEISIPTFYGDEISYVNGFKYAWLIMLATIKSSFVRKGWLSDDRFDGLA